MKIFRGSKAFEAIRLYSGVKIYTYNPLTSMPILLDFAEALNYFAIDPELIWVEVEESEIQSSEEDQTGEECEKCGMIYHAHLTPDEIDKINLVRSKLLSYLNGDKSALDDHSILYASMVLGNFILFHSER